MIAGSGARSRAASDNLLSDEEELRRPDEELTKKSINKIVVDFHESLSKALDQLGEASNAEKHINELIHRANFRFSDL